MAPGKAPLRASDVRERNEKIVLRLIHGRGAHGYSQSEAVLATGLKAPTIFRIFSGLEEAGYISLAPQADEGRVDRKGRRPSSYVIRPDALYTIGVEFWAGDLTLGIFDFSGASLYSRLFPLDAGCDAEGVTAAIATRVQEALDQLKLEKSKVLGLGLGAPGQVNVRTREVSFYSRIPLMKNFPIADLLEKRLSMPVTIHNNCGVIAQSLLRHGGLAEMGGTFMFLLRSGVNGALVDSGRIFTTIQGTTIEAGHLSVAFDGPPCPCGARGCLEKYLTALDSEDLDVGHWLFESFGDALAAGGLAREEAEKKLAEAAMYLSSAVQTVARLYGPRSYLFVAISEEVAAILARLTEERFNQAPSGFDCGKPSFYARAYDTRLAQRGAADLVLDTFLG